ncbi:MAG: membrane protein insertase YidC, partial [Comamonadaceae bacterium]
MNDIRRTILWVILGFSLVMLWDKWQIHNGRQATFFPTPTATAPAAASSAPGGAAAAAASAPGSAVPTAVVTAAPAGAGQVPGAPAVSKLSLSTSVLTSTRSR